ncbi:MAG: glycosyltransferase family 2 protein [Desulfobacteraceae bacterium]|nr:glycosyltransferase family 2 protein [Desulfobacteraceae bacterium]
MRYYNETEHVALGFDMPAYGAMKSPGPNVHIIILNWNGWQDTIECVESCLRLTYSNFHILIVDNYSTDNSYSILRKKFPDIDVLQSGDNLGFSGGNNVGIRFALARGADYIWLLNNDTTVDANALTALVTVADSDSRIGIVGSKLYYHDTPNKIAFAGGYWKQSPQHPYHFGIDEEDQGQFDEIKEVDFITGCSLLIKSAVIAEIGEMHEEYFLYWEDIDWNACADEKGWKILYVPQSHVWHKVSASTGDKPMIQTYYNVRNRLLFMSRHLPNKVVATVVRSVVVAIRYVMKGEKFTSAAYFKGLRDYICKRFGKLDSSLSG